MLNVYPNKYEMYTDGTEQKLIHEECIMIKKKIWLRFHGWVESCSIAATSAWVWMVLARSIFVTLCCLQTTQNCASLTFLTLTWQLSPTMSRFAVKNAQHPRRFTAAPQALGPWGTLQIQRRPSCIPCFISSYSLIVSDILFGWMQLQAIWEEHFYDILF